MSYQQGYDADESHRGLHSAFDRLPLLCAKGVGQLIRVSSTIQVRRSLGSQRFQEEQQRILERYGIRDVPIREFDARGESARAGADRPVFRKLLEAIHEREIHVVLVSDADRIARNDPDSEALYDALQAIGGLLIINGEVNDPGNPSHRFILRLRGLIAGYENEQRAFRSLSSKAAQARDLSLMVRLATGLVWGSPDDAEFVARMHAAGLEELLSEEELAKHRTRVRKDGLRYYVFPFPDAEVAEAGRLAVRWLLEEGSITGLLKRIDSTDWPRPGMFPSVGGHRFDATLLTAEWKPLDRDDGRHDYGRTTLYDWLRSPSIVGTYAARFPMLRELSRTADEFGSEVVVRGAFPSLGLPGDEDRIRAILTNPDVPKIRGSWDGPRNHALAHIRCSHPMPHGRVCGRKLGAMYEVGRDGNYRYTAVVCGVRGHRFSLPPQVDDLVTDMVFELFTPERLRAELERLRVDHGVDVGRINRLERQIKELEASQEWHDHKAFEASRLSGEGSRETQAFHEKKAQDAARDLANLRRETAQLVAASEASAEITDHEYEDIARLATDLPNLVQRARPIPGKVREVMRELIRTVHARRLGTSCYHAEIELYSGQRVARTLIVPRVSAPQPVRMLAHAHLARWLDVRARSTVEGEAEARAAARSLAVSLNRTTSPKRTQWTADRLFAAAYMHAQEAGETRTGVHETSEELARRLHLDPQAVLKRVLSGSFGPAQMRAGEPAVCPSPDELHGAFPVLGTREAAAKAGWSVEGTVRLHTLTRETGWDRYHVQRVAERAGISTDSFGNSYTHRSLIHIPKEGDLERILEASVPANADRTTGAWRTWTQARSLHPGVNITTLEAHTMVVRPGFGENGLATVYIWIDASVDHRVRKPTLKEAIQRAGLALSAADFMQRKVALSLLRKRFGGPSEDAWRKAVQQGHLIEVKAQGPKSRRLSAYAYVPPEVLASTDREVLGRFLRGELRNGNPNSADPLFRPRLVLPPPGAPAHPSS